MPLYDNPPHTADVYSIASTTDSGGGSGSTFTLAQSAVPCFAPTVGSGESERFAQSQIVTQHEIHFKTSALTVSLTRGWKLVVNGATLHVKGIVRNQAAGTIPALMRVTCESFE